ncbi:MAG: hypothetical protein FD130_2621, partial [Halothiobacillaceae bacterium]
MKKICASLLVLVLFAVSQHGSAAGVIDQNGTYRGQIKGVGIGFWGHVGVGLDGVTCRGFTEVVLKKDNPQYKDMLAVLLAAESTGKQVNMYIVQQVHEAFSPGYD